MYYIYRADCYCKSCGDNLVKALTDDLRASNLLHGYEHDEYDSSEWPQPSYDHDSDSQMYCTECECRIHTNLTWIGKWNLIKEMADQISINGMIQHHTLENIKEHGVEMEDVLKHFYYAPKINEMNKVLDK